MNYQESQYQLKQFNFDPSDVPPKDFYNWCLKKKLYKTDFSLQDNSRMQLIYCGLEPFVGVSAVVAFKGDNPIGIILCEHRSLIPEQSKRENPDLSFYNLGFVNIFVKKSQRKRGLATQLVQEMEQLRLASLKNVICPNGKYFFVARELSKVIVSEKSKYTYAIGSDIEHRGRDLEIDNIAYKLTTKEDFKTLKLKEIFDWNKVDGISLNLSSVDEIENKVKNEKRTIRI